MFVSEKADLSGEMIPLVSSSLWNLQICWISVRVTKSNLAPVYISITTFVYDSLCISQNNL